MYREDPQLMWFGRQGRLERYEKQGKFQGEPRTNMGWFCGEDTARQQRTNMRRSKTAQDKTIKDSYTHKIHNLAHISLSCQLYTNISTNYLRKISLSKDRRGQLVDLSKSTFI